MSLIPYVRTLVEEESVNPSKKTGGHFSCETLSFTVAANTEHTESYTLLINAGLLAAHLDCKDVNDGDQLRVEIAPKTTVGTLGTSVSASSTTIPIPSSVNDLFINGTLFVGMQLHLADGGTEDDCGIITEWDEANSDITVQTATVNAFPVGALVKTTALMCSRAFGVGWVEVSSGDHKVYTHGESKIGASFVAAGKTVQVRYKNNDPSNSATVRLTFEYLF